MIDSNPANRSNWDLTQDIERSLLSPYCGSAALFKCPGDRSTVTPVAGPFQGRPMPRVRSISMNFWLGGWDGQDRVPLPSGGEGPISGEGWRVYLRANDLTEPGPSRTIAFLDVREDGITDPSFGIDMAGYPDRPERVGFFYDFPASCHQRAGSLSFADGHSESKRWQDPRTMPPIQKGGRLPLDLRTPNNPDVIWLQERATRKHP